MKYTHTFLSLLFPGRFFLRRRICDQRIPQRGGRRKFLSDGQGCRTGLNAVYDIIGQKGYYRDAIFPLGESSSDNIDEQTGDNGDYGFHYKAISDYRWVPDNPLPGLAGTTPTVVSSAPISCWKSFRILRWTKPSSSVTPLKPKC